MSETIEFTGITRHPLTVERVLRNDKASSLTEVVVLGWAPDGAFHFAASDADMSRALMLIACAERWITDQQDLRRAPRALVEAAPGGAVVLQTRQNGFTGNTCSNCGSARMVTSGHCETCQDCGTTTGCS